MEDIRTYGSSDDDQWTVPDEDRVEWSAVSEDEPPFHIPRD